MDQKIVKEIADLVIRYIAYPFVLLCVAGFLFYTMSGIVKDFLLYIGARFDEVGCGVVLLINGENYRVQKIRYTYIQLKHIECDVLLRIPLKHWKEMDKYMCYNGLPKRRRDDTTS